MNMRTTALALILSSLTALPPAALASRETAHTTFPEAYEAGETRLTLRGVSLLRVGVIFKVYVAGLFVGEGADTRRVLEDVPKRLELAYLRNLAADDIIKAGNDMLRRHLSKAQLAALQPRIDAISRLYVDVKPGDRYALTYVPGRGSTLSLNGRDLGTIEGADFASAYFGIWLDPRTDYPEFQARLLGEKR